ncbi:MAG: 30S ribosome-binding factor RbfA [Nitrospirae bacterium]|nr:30S ribosome-binding factor RbfA [Nitrospirota bacterium]
MLPYKRSRRVGDLIREEVADIIMNKLKDPRVGFITVTGADVTEDLKLAKVYVSILKEEEKEATLEILNSAKGFIRAELAKRMRMKFIPALTFRVDESLAYGNRIEKLLKEIKQENP